MLDQPFPHRFRRLAGDDQLDFTGPHQFLSRLPSAEVIVASPGGGAVPSEGLVFADTRRLADVSSCDLICVPGGMNATGLALDRAFVGEVRRLGQVCALCHVGMHRLADPRCGRAARGASSDLPLGVAASVAAVRGGRRGRRGSCATVPSSPVVA